MLTLNLISTMIVDDVAVLFSFIHAWPWLLKLKKPARLRAAVTTVPQNFPPLQFCLQPRIFAEMCTQFL